MPPSTHTPTAAARDTQGTPKKVALDVVTASQYDDERTLTVTPSRSASGFERASSSEEAWILRRFNLQG